MDIGHFVVDGLDGLGLQPRLVSFCSAAEVEQRLRYLDALIAIWVVAGEGREVVENLIRAQLHEAEGRLTALGA
jgi:hypothetical protein